MTMFSPVPLTPVPLPASLPAPLSVAPPDDQLAQARSYLDCIQLIERMHSLLHDVIRDEFRRLGHEDLTPVQAMLIYNLGGAEVSAGELRSRGIYHGANVSYNLKKLVQMGYVRHVRCPLDRRAVRISLTQQGADLRQTLMRLFVRHADALAQAGVLDDPPLALAAAQLRRIARHWGDQIRYIY